MSRMFLCMFLGLIILRLKDVYSINNMYSVNNMEERQEDCVAPVL